MAGVKTEANSSGVAEARAEPIRRINYEPVLLVDPVRYRECRRNHAASMGRYILDGCGEFLKGGEDGPLDALLCAVCGCHRSFHRKEPPSCPHRASGFRLHQLAAAAAPPPPLPLLPLPPPPAILYNAEPAAPVNQQQNDVNSETFSAGEVELEMTKNKKRSRTRLTKEMKNRMAAFAERLGWRPQRHDEEEISQFCSELGIKCKVFKVWVSNNRRKTEAGI